jgi:hypothetical protein
MIKYLNWNVEWKTPRIAGGKWIAQKIGELDPDVSCLTEITEASADCFPPDFSICMSVINDDEGKPLIGHCAVFSK